MVVVLPTSEKRMFESHQLGGNSIDAMVFCVQTDEKKQNLRITIVTRRFCLL